jgi:4-amino-4-deoxy-L-arabinose transferase-like glycosyltransferase/putative flippase GtrA
MTTIAKPDVRELTSLRTRLDLIRRSPHAGRVVRCLIVSAITTCVSLTVLTLLLRLAGMEAWRANVVAVAVGIVPSYLLNRRWVWGVSGRSDPGREVLPFWLMSFAGLIVSTSAAGAVDRLATAASWSSNVHTASVLAANVGAFALLWIAQYLVLERVLFGPRASKSVDVLAPPVAGTPDVADLGPVAPPVDHAADRVRHGGRIRRWWRGRPEDPAWVRPSLIALLVGTAALYLWNLSASGWANSFYAAAVQAGSKSWKAFFFGSSDAANSITVDKPPMSLWPMEISARVFGLSSWSLLVPQALMGVASVGLVYATVRRWFRAGAGLMAGAILALTPVAALMFRFDNPDGLLTLLMCGAAYTTLRGIESAKVRWSVATGALIGLGFLTKQLQVLLVVPGFAFAYLVAARTTFWRRVRDLAVAGGSMIAAAGWWMAIVMLTPVASRPYIGGSQHNSVWELTFGYNGFGRLTGNETGSVGGGGAGGPGGSGMWGATGLTRMFGSEIGGQIAWLLPAAIAALLLGLWLTRRARRTDMARASLLVWGGWLVVTGVTFSLMAGIFHAYYTVALAPAVAALVGIGASMLWARRSSWWATATMGVATMASACWAAVLLDRATGWNTWLAPMIVVAGCVAAIGFAAASLLSETEHEPVRGRVLSASAVLALGAVLAGPTAWTVQTVSTPHTGSIVTAGPTVAGAMGGPGGGFGRPGAGPGGGNFTPPAGFAAGGGTGGFGGARGGAGGIGGLLNGSTPSAALVQTLEKDASSYTWVAATVGSNSASGYQLATGDPVMPIGGFNGSDPSPTLAQFEQWVHEGRIHYFIGGGGFGGPGGSSSGGSNVGQQISSWVSSHFTPTTVGGVTLYDLTQPLATS